MIKALFDTNILIDYLNGIPQAKAEIERYDRPLISVISWIEVLVGAKSEQEHDAIKAFLAQHFEQIPLNIQIAELSVSIRQSKRIRLPDAIIQATAEHHQALIISRNSKDFPADAPNVRIPYVL